MVYLIVVTLSVKVDKIIGAVNTFTATAVADPGRGAMVPPCPDKDYLLCTSWHFLVKNPLDHLNNEF